MNSENLDTAYTLNLINDYVPVFLVGFVLTLLSVPIFRIMALQFQIVDRPDGNRKVHQKSVPYLGGCAVLSGFIGAVVFSYFVGSSDSTLIPIPFAVLFGATIITVGGAIDDAWGLEPRLKIACQLVAAAVLAFNDIGTRVAYGVLNFILHLFGTGVAESDWWGYLAYGLGTAVIAIFVLGGCNSANLLDGLDGLLTGTTAIAAIGLLGIAIMLDIFRVENSDIYIEEINKVTSNIPHGTIREEQSLSGARITLLFALFGCCLAFLIYNFRPAIIFLGDAGSMLMGYLIVVSILMLGESGRTELVLSGFIVFLLPVMDTLISIIRRWRAGISMSVPDKEHLHHKILRMTGGVIPTVLIFYLIALSFAFLGNLLTWLALFTEVRRLVVYAVVLVFLSFIFISAMKNEKTGSSN